MSPPGSFFCGGKKWKSTQLGEQLTRHAEALRAKLGEGGASTGQKLQFPMYVVPMETFQEMTEVRSHEELLASGSLILFDEKSHNVIFVSHEWCGTAHADPAAEQLKVLQEALKHMFCEGTRISVDVTQELMFGQLNAVNISDMRSQPLALWYDYFCVPQLLMSVRGQQAGDQLKALDSIPVYIEKCRYFFILSPYVRHHESGELLSKRTWATRGWCRLERLASQFGKHDGQLVEIQSSKRQVLTVPYEYLREPVGEGVFTVASDRERAGAVVRRIFQNKMRSCLEAGNFHLYRLLLNLQRVHFRNLPINPIDDMIPGFRSDETDPCDFFFENFMYQHGFVDVLGRDDAGWTPLCYAAMGGNLMLISSLLERRADPNDCITKADPKIFLNAGTTLLSMCVYLGNQEAMRLLLSHGADPHARDGFNCTPMHYACVNHNLEAVAILREQGASISCTNTLQHSPIMIAGGAGTGGGSAEVIEFLLRETEAAGADLSLTLHYSILFAGASVEVVTALIDANVDINKPLVLPRLSPLGLAFGYFSLRHHWKPTAVSYYALHHSHATPLMCCMLCGAFEAAAALIAAGARLDLKNRRGKTAADLAYAAGAPDFVMGALHELHGSPHECRRLIQNRSGSFGEEPCDLGAGTFFAL